MSMSDPPFPQFADDELITLYQALELAVKAMTLIEHAENILGTDGFVEYGASERRREMVRLAEQTRKLIQD